MAPAELGFGSGMTCWRRLRDWNNAGVWQQLHEVPLPELRASDVLFDPHVRRLRTAREQVDYVPLVQELEGI